MKGKIKVGTGVYQDFGFGKWPIEGIDPDTVFDCVWKPDISNPAWDCQAPGVGEPGNYGNGTIYVRDINGIEPIVEWPITRPSDPNPVTPSAEFHVPPRSDSDGYLLYKQVPSYRKVSVKGRGADAYFHCFSSRGVPVAIIEWPSGVVEDVPIGDIKFLEPLK